MAGTWLRHVQSICKIILSHWDSNLRSIDLKLTEQAVKVRGESMAAAAKMGTSHGMLSIIGLEDTVLEDICAKVRLKLGGDVVCQTANYLFPTGRVVSGHKDALNEVQVRSSHVHCHV